MSRARSSNSDAVAATTASLIVVDGFLPPDLALQMRRDIDTHFASPEKHRAETHQVWNYWFVPDSYTYLRTAPEKVIERGRIDTFYKTLRDWSIATLGMANVTWPYLSLYVGGCRQNWHNDSVNGRFGFVYSLTRDERRTIGGETLVRHEIDPFRAHLANAGAGREFYRVIEPRFNRLVIFDDRLPHSVERIDGPMDPVEGRFVLHGHVSEAGTIVGGALSEDMITGPLLELLRQIREELSAAAALYNGPLILRLTIAAGGTVAACAVLVDRVIHPDPGHVEWEPLRAKLVERFAGLRFPPAGGETVLIQPLLFGGPVGQR
jgi:Rps23 Pro-64 3,4-dihydroxylase Tpa1-like proline 4-hydroxylase